MAKEAIEGRTNIWTFFEHLTKHFFRVLGTNIIIIGTTTILILMLVVSSLLGGFVIYYTDSMFILFIIAVILLTIAILPAVFLLFIQFYPHAIIFEESSPIDSLRSSVNTVRINLLDTIRYFVLFGTIAGVGGWIIFELISLWGTRLTCDHIFQTSRQPISTIANFVLIHIAVNAVFGAVLTTYSVSFLNAIRNNN